MPGSSATASQFALLRDRRFLPLFITQFLGAFHDNLFKNAFCVLLLFGGHIRTGFDPKVLTTIAAGVFILPFILFSAAGGQLADHYPKEKIMRVIKLAEIGIAGLGATALLAGSLPLCFATLFALGAHSAFFGPGKYAILPQHLVRAELIGGNALLNTGTFLAILGGTATGTLLVTTAHGPACVSALLFICAVAGFFAARRIPSAPPVLAGSAPGEYRPGATYRILRRTLGQPPKITLSIVGISWFYFLGGMFTTQLPNFARATLGVDEKVLGFFLILFSVGIALGGLLNNRLLKGAINVRYVPFAAIGITLFSFDLFLAGHSAVAPVGPLKNITIFLDGVHGWRIAADLAMIALCGGFFVVPLGATVQHETAPGERARIQAGNAILNAVFIALSSAFSAAMLSAGLSVPDIFLAFAAANGLAAMAMLRLRGQTGGVRMKA